MLSLLRVAAKNVLRNRRRSLITIAAISIGIAVILTFRGFVNGAQESITSGVVQGGIGAVQLHRVGYLHALEAAPLNLDIDGTPAAVDAVRAVPGVKNASARIPFGAMVNYGDVTVFAGVMAIDPANEYKVSPKEAETLSSGTRLGVGPGVLLSSDLAKSVGAKIGDKIAFITNDRDGSTNAIEAPLVGVFPTKDQAQAKLAYITLPVAQELLRMPGRASEIAVSVGSLEQADAVAAKIEAAMQGKNIEVHTWKQRAPDIISAMKLQETIVGLGSGILLFVVLAGVVNTMLMSVLERVREIGTMLSLGVRKRQVIILFALEAVTLGVVGGALGSTLGLLVTFFLNYRGIQLGDTGNVASTLVRPTLTVANVGLGMVFAIIGALFAALYPASRAAALRPVEALRHT
jgi:putative ABC transport system permease protein